MATPKILPKTLMARSFSDTPGVGPSVFLPTEAQYRANALTPPTSAEEQNAAYDRGPGLVGPNPWDKSPPDGVTILVHDVLGVAAQFGHGCG